MGDYTNLLTDGEVTAQTPDAREDFYKIEDKTRDNDYLHAKICEALKVLSEDPTKDVQILYGGVITDSGSGQIGRQVDRYCQDDLPSAGSNETGGVWIDNE